MQGNVFRYSLFSLVIVYSLGLAAPAPQEKPLDFNRDVRPILSDKCFSCHGPDAKARMANLRLDTKDGAFEVRKSGSIISPSDSAHSKLYQRISQSNKALRMPPPASGLSLSDKEIEMLKRWIDSGAKWELHWAYEPPKRPEPPAGLSAAFEKWVRNPVDQFVAARLSREGLKPSPEADRITLLRRVTFDLTGLPPTPEEIDAFVKDKSPQSYEQVVDRLLASPRYGERMAMKWLDLARYADTHGYHIDSHRSMWPWRDWVIKAYNSNMPFDRFTIEQLAGDLLPTATTDQKVATGFNRNHMINFEGGAIPEEYLNEYLVDRVDTTSAVWLGTTMGCSRCHDHKYDPVKQKDYYSFYAFFNSIPEKGLDGRKGNAEPILQLPNPEQAKRLATVTVDIGSHESDLCNAVVEPMLTKWEVTRLSKFPAEPRTGLAAHYDVEGSFEDLSGHYRHGRVTSGELNFTSSPVGQAAELKGETRVEMGDGGGERTPGYSVALWLRSNGLNAMPILKQEGRFALAAGTSLPLGDLTRGAYLYLTTEDGKRYRTRDRIFGNKFFHFAFVSDGHEIRAFVNGTPQELVPSEETPLSVAGSGFLLPKGFKGALDDLRLYDHPLTPEEVRSLAVDQPIRAALFALKSKRTKEQKEALRDYFLEYEAPAEYRKLFNELVELKAVKKDLDETIPSVMVMKDMDTPRETHVLGRGDYRNLGEKVNPDVPRFLPPLPKDAARNRLTLAKWLVEPENPLTARVAVNRYWSMYFGNGLVKTVEDFGSQGEAPSHPELLDWLATEFIRTGWDVKGMQRLIVTSAAYRQSSRSTPGLNERDPENRLLARGPRFRLPAEMIRDSALSASGLLDGKIGGPSVFPYNPKGVWEDIAYGDVYSAQVYPTDTTKDDLYRRSIYTFWKRTAPPPALNTFDAPDREKCTVRRVLTNTPLQALVLLNDPTYVESARVLAQRMMLEGGADASSRIRYGFRLVTGRMPDPKEMAILRTLAKREMAEYDTHPENAAKLLTVGEAKPDPKVDKAMLAAWTTVASSMLNLDEAITKE